MAYTGNSLVDYLNSTGAAADYGSRAKLAQSQGISGYTGSAGQNTQLLNTLRGGSQPTSQPAQNSTVTAPGAGSFEDTLKRAQELQNQAIAPLVTGLQNSQDSIKQQYAGQQSALEAQRKPLQDRYDQLLSQVKQQQTQSINKQTLTTSNELGKRGILPSSGLNQQEVINATEPINQQYTALGNDVGFQGQQAQQAITSQEAGLSASQIQDLRNVQNAIAQAQSGGSKDAINLALQQVQNQQALAQQGFQNNLATQQLGISQAAQGISAQQAAADIALKNAQIKQQDPAYIQQLLSSLGIGGGVVPGLSVTQTNGNIDSRPGLTSFVK